MKIKLNYFAIPFLALFTALLGSAITSNGMSWYQTINLPDIAPPGVFIGLVWTVIFILSAISILFFWNKSPRDERFKVVVYVLILNIILNVFWSWLFFGQHEIGAAFFDAVALDIVTIGLMILIWPVSRFSSLLFLPYVVWVAFASYLNYLIWILN
jgi:benzodiazapine receptor